MNPNLRMATKIKAFYKQCKQKKEASSLDASSVRAIVLFVFRQTRRRILSSR